MTKLEFLRKASDIEEPPKVLLKSGMESLLVSLASISTQKMISFKLPAALMLKRLMREADASLQDMTEADYACLRIP